MLPEIAKLVGALLAGVAIGALYFGGLWWTVRRVPRSPRPYVLVFGSLAVRMTVAAGGMVLLGLVSWRLVLAAMVGFLGVRLALTRRLRPDVYDAADNEEKP